MDREKGRGSAARNDRSRRRLRGRRLTLARSVWLGVAGVTLGLFALSVPAGYGLLRTGCTGRVCGPEQLRPEAVRRLGELGIPLDLYAAYQTTLVVVFALAFCAIAAAIFWRRSDDVMALYTSLTLVLSGVFLPEWMASLASAYPSLLLTVNLLDSLMYCCLFILFYMFPDGRFTPGWTRWPAVAWIALLGTRYVVPESPLAPISWPPVLLVAVITALIGSCLLAQVYRYTRVSGPAERQQTKWVVLALTMMLGLLALVSVLPAVEPTSGNAGSLYDLVVDLVSFLAVLLVPIAFGIAILRHRLFDIDVLINRALVYGALTVSLALVYVGVVIGLQHVLRALTGEGTQLAVVASTLAIAALFSPLRRRIQKFIDRSFYRRKYDAGRILESYSTRLRDDPDLQSLGGGLAWVVSETVQPAHVSLWLREPGRHERAQGSRDGRTTGGQGSKADPAASGQDPQTEGGRQ